MHIFILIGNVFKVFFFFANLWTEKDKAKAEKKKKVADEITAAFTETDKKIRASRLNAAVGGIKRL